MQTEEASKVEQPLRGIRVLSLAINLPGPLAAARLASLGAAVTKVTPPYGDPLAWVVPAWHDVLQEGQDVIALDLKSDEGQARLAELLGSSDLFLTAMRPVALARLGLDPTTLSARYPRLCHVLIVGYPAPFENRPGHDLTYQASVGLLNPPDLPYIPLADFAGAERAVTAALLLLLTRERTGRGGWQQVALAEALAPFADALRYGLFAPGSLLAGGSPLYGLYRAREGWIALAALEPHFSRRLSAALGLEELTAESLAQAFHGRTAAEWETWAIEQDVPLAAVRDPLCLSAI